MAHHSMEEAEAGSSIMERIRRDAGTSSDRPSMAARSPLAGRRDEGQPLAHRDGALEVVLGGCIATRRARDVNFTRVDAPSPRAAQARTWNRVDPDGR